MPTGRTEKVRGHTIDSIGTPARGSIKRMGMYGVISPTSPVGYYNPKMKCGTAGQ